MRKRHSSTHHITPASKGGRTEKSNLATIDALLHEKFHSLFENKTPEEIIDWLVNYFWKDQNGRSGYHFIYYWFRKNAK